MQHLQVLEGGRAYPVYHVSFGQGLHFRLRQTVVTPNVCVPNAEGCEEFRLYPSVALVMTTPLTGQTKDPNYHFATGLR